MPRIVQGGVFRESLSEEFTFRNRCDSSTRMKYLKDENLTYYESTLKRILQRPITAGILFSLFFSVAFFPDRPPLLIDIVILLLLIPITDIGLRLSSKNANIYIWLFVLSVILLIAISFFLALHLSLNSFSLIIFYSLLLVSYFLDLLFIFLFLIAHSLFLLTTSIISCFLALLS